MKTFYFYNPHDLLIQKPFYLALLIWWTETLSAANLSVKLQSDPKEGERVMAIVDAPGEVGIESEIAGQSFSVPGSGRREVDLGNGRKANFGFHRVKVTSGAETSLLLIPVLSSVRSIPVPPPAPLSRSERSAIEKYFAALKAKPGHYFDKWPKAKVAAENVVKASYVGTMGLFCAAEPSKISCLAAASGVADLAMELALGFGEFAAEEMKRESTLTSAEAAAVKSVISSLKAAKTLVELFSGEIGEKVVAGAELIMIGLDPNDTAKLAIGLQKDSAGKGFKLYYFVKKMK